MLKEYFGLLTLLETTWRGCFDIDPRLDEGSVVG
jgi:hypothetical protein